MSAVPVTVPDVLPSAETPPAAGPAFAPTPGAERLAGIDFTRGVALLGILLVNTELFFQPVAVLFDPARAPRSGPADSIVSAAVQTFCQGMFVSQFSLLFGYGLVRQMDRAQAAGRSAGIFSLRRLGALALFGAVHGIFLWYGDILFLYACLGFWLLLIRRASPRGLLVTGAALLAFGLFLQGLWLMVPAPSVGQGPSVELPASWPASLRGMAAGGFDPTSAAWMEAEIRAFRDGPWTDATLFRAVTWLSFLWICLLGYGWHILGMMVLGGLLLRTGFFEPARLSVRRRMLLLALPLGLALTGAGLLCSHLGRSEGVRALGQFLHALAITVLPLGYLAGLTLLGERLPERWRRPVCRAGRMSLTVYLLETVLMTALAYHWGLGLFGAVGPAAQALLAVAAWLALVLVSDAWLRQFRQGPMEWLWRRLEYGRTASGVHP